MAEKELQLEVEREKRRKREEKTKLKIQQRVEVREIKTKYKMLYRTSFQIYALNKVMRALENEKFKAFMSGKV